MANNLTIRNAKIIFRNFAGAEKAFNPKGRRNFSVIIDDANLARQLMADGWNLKPLKKRDEDEDQRYHLSVAVNYGPYPPQITLVCGRTKTSLDESTVQMIDWADIEKVDLTIRPREYEVGGRKGVKAYLKVMYVTVQEDELAADYADLDEPYSEEEDIPF